MATDTQLRVMARHFLIACIWADSPEGTHPRGGMDEAREALEGLRIARRNLAERTAEYEGG